MKYPKSCSRRVGGGAILCGLLAAFLLIVAAPARAAEQPNAGTKPAKHFLWKAQSGKATVYLLGSIHAAKKGLYPLDDVIEKAFKQSDKLVVEVEMDAATQLDAAIKLATAAKLPAGDTLNKHLDEKTKKLLGEYGRKSNFPVKALRGYRPWFVALNITMTELRKHGYSAAQGVDLHFQKLAKAANKPIESLETADGQVKLLSSMPEKVQVLMLKETLEESKTLGKVLDGMFKAWKAGDVEKLDELTLKDIRKPEYKPLYKTLFVERNKKMFHKIQGFLKTDATYFVVVGSGHLIGKGGVVQLLRAKGVKVEQL